MKPIYKYLIAAALGVFLSVVVTKCTKRNELVSQTITTNTVRDTVFVKVIDSTRIKFLEEELDKANFTVQPVIINVPDGTTIETTDSIAVETTKYVGKEVLDNGTIDYEIYADSLRATRFKLTTEDKVITNTVTNTITKVLPPISRLYASGGLESSVNGFTPQAVSIGLMYNRRQKWGAGVEIRQDFSGLLPPQNSTTLGVRIYIGL